MRIAKGFFKFGLILIGIIVVIEITLRLTISYKLQKWGPCQYQPDTVLGYRYKANSTGNSYNAAFDRPYKINSHGFAGAEFTTKKTKGIYRIAVVGASDEAGLYTDGPLNYINVAEDLLKKNGYKVEILNLAIDGHGRSIRNVEFLKGPCAEYEPDLILFKNLEFPLEDYREYRTTYKGILIKYKDTSQRNLNDAKAYIDNELAHKDLRIRLYDYSYIYRWMVKSYLEQYQKPKSKFWQWCAERLFVNGNKVECYARHVIFWPKYQYKPTVYSDEASMQVLGDLSEILSRRNTKLLIFTTYAVDDPQGEKEIFAKYGVNYLPLQVIHKHEYSFGELNGHTSQEGHKAIGYALFKALKDSISQAFIVSPLVSVDESRVR